MLNVGTAASRGFSAKGGCNEVETLLGFVAVVVVAISMVGCLEMEGKITIYPDGSGKIEGKTVFGEQMSAMLTMAEQQGGDALKEAAGEGIGLSGEGVIVTKSNVSKDGEKYKAEFTAYCKDMAKVGSKEQKGATPPCKMEKQTDGSFVFILGDENKGAGDDSGVDKEAEIKQMEAMKGMFNGFRMSFTYVFPGDITKIDGFGSDVFVSHKGRELSINIDFDKVIKASKEAIKTKSDVLKVYCKAPTAEVEAELKKFRAELKKAEEEAKEKSSDEADEMIKKRFGGKLKSAGKEDKEKAPEEEDNGGDKE